TSRREFPAKVKEQAYERANGRCEIPECGSELELGRFHYDHIVPDAIGGGNDLGNCQVICILCHRDKTGGKDAPVIAKNRRIRRKLKGIKKQSKFRGWRKFDGTLVMNPRRAP